MPIFGWLRRLLTRALSPEVLRMDSAPASRAAPIPPPPPPHKDPNNDTAVIMLEDVRKDGQRAMSEARAVCESARRARTAR